MRLAADNPMRTVLLTTLIFEVIVFGLAIPVMIQVSDVSPAAAGGFGGGAALLALIAAGVLRKPYGYPVAWLAQVAGVALGFLTPSMYLVGGMFLGLWLISFMLGKRIESGHRDVAVQPDKK